jgi:hypothetical protein
MSIQRNYQYNITNSSLKSDEFFGILIKLMTEEDLKTKKNRNKQELAKVLA